MKYFSTFSGAGGFEIGMTERHTCVGLSEIDRHACSVLRYRFPYIKNYGDITKIDWSLIPDFDLLVGGSPCQSFSIAGKRAGFDGASGLFWEYLRCLKEKKPDYFIWENVKGVLSSNGGWDFAAIVDAFSEAGYALWWQVLNAKDFGVPQNRERIFIVGTRNGSPREVFFKTGTTRKDNEQPTATTIDANYAKGLDNHGARTGIEIVQPALRELSAKHTSIGFRTYDPEGIGRTIASQAGGAGAKTGLYALQSRIRRLTPKECERLMSWPDDWTRYGTNEKGDVVEMSDSQRYKMCGNGVVSKVVEALMKAHFGEGE